jgi:hypothetical protein
MSTEFLLDDKHGNVSLTLFTFADDATNYFAIVVGHDGESWELTNEVVIGEDRVWFCQLLANGLDHPVQFFLFGELLEFQFGLVEIVHYIILGDC